MTPLHSLLKRQLKQYFGSDTPPAQFIEAINKAYFAFDEDRNMLERSLDFSSQELFQANSDMRAEKALLENIISNVPHFVFWKDRNSAYLGCNQQFAKVAGLARPEDIVGKTDYDLAWKKEEADFFRAVDKEVMTSGQPMLNIEESQLQADGKQAILLTSKVPLRNASGEVVGILGVFADITERKKMEAHLMQSQKMETMGTLAGGIAHDLNNQLTPLIGYIDLVLRMTLSDAQTHPFLIEANRSALRCAEVVQRLVNFSKPSSQKKTPLKMDEILEELKNLLPRFLPSTIHSEIICQDDIWSVDGNETELHTVLVNLITNARDAMPRGGSLEISARNVQHMKEVAVGREPRTGSYIVLSVKDSGAGMTSEVLDRIFEPFFTTKKRDKGTGLGLPMVFNIIRDHGGWIDVSSQLGKGSIFQIYLPARTGVETDESHNSFVNGLQAAPTGHGTILVADDEEAIRNLAKLFLEKLGYEVLLAKDGEEAIQTYENHQREIAAVVLDMTMPKLTGRDTFKTILEINPSAKIILASGYTDEGSSKQLLEEGACDFLQKPYTIQPLAQAVRRAIDG